jgi:serine/threonine-protein kinase HipA
LTLLRWALFQFLIGNSDAHGKNFSFYVKRQGLEPAPWYDLIAVCAYPGLDHEMAMAYGDAFSLDEVGAFQLADFTKRCGIERRLLAREATRLSKLAAEHAAQQALAREYIGEERVFVEQLRDFVVAQGARLAALARKAVGVRDEYLLP